MTNRLDHANLQVRDVDGMIHFLQAAFPDFQVRGQGKTWQGTRWVHVGNDQAYVALNEATREPAERWVPYGGKPGVNHLGFEVDDAEALRHRLGAAGFQETTVPNAHPYRKRVYFHDSEGNDWEFIQYLSEDPAQRHDYDLPDAT